MQKFVLLLLMGVFLVTAAPFDFQVKHEPILFSGKEGDIPDPENVIDLI